MEISYLLSDIKPFISYNGPLYVPIYHIIIKLIHSFIIIIINDFKILGLENWHGEYYLLVLQIKYKTKF